MKRIFYLFSSLVIASTLILSTEVKALSGWDFQAGRIMDDGIFFNPNTIDANGIQAFLNSKVPVCDTWGTQPYGGTTRAAYGASKGNPAPFICLKDYRQDTPNRSAEAGLCEAYSGGNKSAAQIIKDVGQACGVNPKVLIVLLEKEQSLITDDWPWKVQYEKATGFGCPDTAPCDPQFGAFFDQVYYAARQFKRYARDANLFRYRAGRDNYVQYNPDAGCGGKNVYISTQATAGLYNYTPYQPNDAVKAAAPGQTVHCGAYGNMNFWRMYNNWFGGTTLDYTWHTNGYKILNETASQYVDPGQLQPGQRYLVDIAATNTGPSTWYNSGPTPIRFGTNYPPGHSSFLCDRTWHWCGRPVNLRQETVAPGQIGNFQFFINAPYAPGDYREHFKPLAENLAWMNNSSESLGIRVVSPGSFSWHTNGYKLLNSTVSEYVDPGQLSPNQKYYVDIAVVNTGTATWRNDGNIPVRFGTNHSPGHSSILCDNETWLWCGRPVSLRESTVAPGQVGHFNFWIKTPSTPGAYREHFKPLAENYAWMNDSSESLGIVVK